MKRLARTALSIGLVAFIGLGMTGCGGGGGSGSGSPSPAPTPGRSPPAPTNVSASPGDRQITLRWNSVSSATSYNVYWDTASGVDKENGEKIKGVFSPCLHSGLTNDVTYYYVVTSVNGHGESKKSKEVSARPSSEPPLQFWMKVFEKPDLSTNRFETVQITDNGYICGGSFKRGVLPWLVKVDKDGNLLWQKEYRRSVYDSITGPTGDEFTLIEKVPTGYLVARDYVVLPSGATAIWLMELNSAGNIVWEKAYADPGDRNIRLTAMSLRPTGGGGYLLGARIESSWEKKVLVLKVDSQGEIAWQKTYQLSEEDFLQYIQKVSSGGYLAVGYTWNGTDYDLWVLRLDNQGNLLWQKRYGGLEWDFGYSVQEIAGNRFLVNAGTASFGQGNYDAWILCLDSQGEVLWQKAYGGPADDHLYLMEKIVDEYVFAGTTYSFGTGLSDAWLVALDGQGQILWQRVYGGGVGEEIWDIKFSEAEEALLAAGFTGSLGLGSPYAWLLKLDRDGYTDGACDWINDSDAIVTDTDVVAIDTTATIETVNLNILTATDPIITDTDATEQMICPQ